MSDTFTDAHKDAVLDALKHIGVRRARAVEITTLETIIFLVAPASKVYLASSTLKQLLPSSMGFYIGALGTGEIFFRRWRWTVL